jgi:shikimate dehydrogenase
MNEFCLIGHPLGHSISPQIHERLFNLSNTCASYVLKDIAPESLGDQVGQLRGLTGFNVTIPHKQAMIGYMATIDRRAARYNAVNTVCVEGGEFHGYNTDVEGFLRALGHADIPLTGKVLLCGAGGVSSMMAYEALDRGCALTVATRKIGGATRFAEELRAHYTDAKIEVSSLAYLSGSYDLILNGTPAGMYPDLKGCPVPTDVARSAKAVFDAVYNPTETVLMKTARDAGAKVEGGLTMLVWQAAAAQELWTGARFRPEEIETLCHEMEVLLQDEFSGEKGI